MADERDPGRDDQERPEADPMDNERQYQPPEKGYEFPDDRPLEPDVANDDPLERPDGEQTPDSDWRK